MNFGRLQSWARQLRQHTLTIYYAARDSRTPLLVRLLALLIAAYALSPIDLIPDFIPLLGLLDDLILLPLSLALIVRLTPPAVMKDAHMKALQTVRKPVSYAAAAFIIIFWLIVCWIVLRNIKA